MKLITKRVHHFTSLHIDNDTSRTPHQHVDNSHFMLMEHLFEYMVNNYDMFRLRDVDIRWSVDKAFYLLMCGLSMLDKSSIQSLRIDSTYMEQSANKVVGPYIRACLILGSLRRLTLKANSFSNNNDLFSKCMVDVLKGPIEIKMANDCYFDTSSNEDLNQSQTPQSRMTSFLEKFFNNNCSSESRIISFTTLTLWAPGDDTMKSYHNAIRNYCDQNGVMLTQNTSESDDLVLTKNADSLTISHMIIMREFIISDDE